MGLILSLTIGFSLVAFVLGDLLTSNTSLFQDNGTEIGSINGESISAMEFDAKYQENVENQKINTNSENIDAQTLDMLREQTWNQFINDKVLGRAHEALGVAVSKEELWDMVQGQFVHPKIKEVQFFKDSLTGIFKPEAVVRYLNSLKDNPEANNQWLSFESGIKRERVGQKYLNLIKGGMYTTKSEALENKMEVERKATVNWFSLLYASIPDSSIKPTDDELKAYYHKHSNNYKQETNTRNLEYVNFDIAPSPEDFAITEASLKEVMDEFRTTQKDSEFVMRNSDVKDFRKDYLPESSLPPSVGSLLMASPVGTVLGPVMEGQSYFMIKSMDFKDVPDSVKARHILISNSKADSATAMARLDSLKSVIRSGKGKFAELAEKFSDDPGSGAKGGDLGWFQEGTMVKPFNDACFFGKKGDMPIVVSQFGVHLIEVQELASTSKRVQFCVVEKKVEISSKTDRTVFAKATEFASKATDKEAFEKIVVDEKLIKRVADGVKEDDKTVPGLESPRELIRWAYRAKEGEISKVMQFGNVYVVAMVGQVREAGVLPLEQVKDKIMPEVVKEKKAEMLTEKIKAAKTSGITLDALAKALGANVTANPDVTFSAGYFGSAGTELEVAGSIFGLKKGEVSKPIKGNTGVFVVQVTDLTEPQGELDAKPNKSQMEISLKGRVDYQVFQALKKNSGIVDKRAKFF